MVVALTPLLPQAKNEMDEPMKYPATDPLCPPETAYVTRYCFEIKPGNFQSSGPEPQIPLPDIYHLSLNNTHTTHPTNDIIKINQSRWRVVRQDATDTARTR